MTEWIRAHEVELWWMAGLSVVMFVGTLVAVPILVARIPADYFAHPSRQTPERIQRHPAIRLGLLIAKNLLGLCLLAAGLAMLVLPGQGLLTIVVALTLIDFPGKYRLERWLVAKRPILRSINWLRSRSSREPLIVEGRNGRTERGESRSQ